jgi:hypothetical protein
MYKLLSKGSIFIQVNKQDDGRIALLAGGYRNVTTGESIAVSGLGGATFGAIGAMGAPGTERQVQITWFNSLLDYPSFDIINAASTLPDMIIVEEFISSIPSDEGKENIISIKNDGNLYVAYPVKNQSVVKVVKVE